MSEAFADYINYWRHNGYWLFDSPDVIGRLAEQNAILVHNVTASAGRWSRSLYGMTAGAKAMRLWIPPQLSGSATATIHVP